MSKNVEVIQVSPQALQDAPDAVGRELAKMMRRAGDAFGIVLIGTREETIVFQESNLWHFMPAEQIEP